MKAQLISSTTITIELPEYFSYNRHGIVFYDRVIGGDITEVQSDINTYPTAVIVKTLRDVHIDDFTEITREQFRAKVFEVAEAALA